MKNKILTFIAGVVLTSFSISCTNEGDVKISVTDSDDTYEFYAKYDKKKTRRVQDFINSKVAPSSYSTDDEMEITVTLDDKTEFELVEAPGKVRIKLDKEDNSNASYHRIKEMCEGIKKVIGQK